MKIERQDIRAALRGFLELLESTDKQASIEILELWLGQLAFLQHFVDDPIADDDLLFESPDHHAYWMKLIEQKFPSLGDYDIPVNTSQNASPLEDLTGIAAEISECLRRWEVAGADAALWYFQFGYQSDWGMRLRNLQAHLQKTEF